MPPPITYNLENNTLRGSHALLRTTIPTHPLVKCSSGGDGDGDGSSSPFLRSGCHHAATQDKAANAQEGTYFRLLV